MFFLKKIASTGIKQQKKHVIPPIKNFIKLLKRTAMNIFSLNTEKNIEE